ncbi:alcohol dehydrogenase catalytic domain-containing protein [Novosphingobium aquae]|uniref:Alcohol dehydrogenase catalytic domain-containing protein n=1 Tax=Novosphingobium aquae TaxID=3133435 RepID=A0ABU8S7J0_9SPHN
MKAWLFTGVGEPLQMIDRADPVPGPGQVVIDVKAAGLCHSDCGFLDGTLTWMLPGLPMILGHEVAGEISAVGDGVTDHEVGERVVLNGPEEFAAGWRVDGGYATKCLAMASGLVKLPPEVSYMQGAAATDAGMTSYGAIMGSGQMQTGQKVGIIGLGGLGMTGARIAVVNGGEVYAAEPRRETWDKARALGLREIVADVSELAQFQCDLIVDFAGFGTTTAGAISAVKPGGTVVQVGLGKTEATINTAELTGKMVTLRGSRGGAMPGATEAVIAHMARGELEIEANALGFDEIPQGLDRLKAGGVVGRLVATP